MAYDDDDPFRLLLKVSPGSGESVGDSGGGGDDDDLLVSSSFPSYALLMRTVSRGRKECDRPRPSSFLVGVGVCFVVLVVKVV